MKLQQHANILLYVLLGYAKTLSVSLHLIEIGIQNDKLDKTQ